MEIKLTLYRAFLCGLYNHVRFLGLIPFQAAYGMTHLHPADWLDLVDRFRTDDALFQKYYK